jgi:hypothetical protein
MNRTGFPRRLQRLCTKTGRRFDNVLAIDNPCKWLIAVGDHRKVTSKNDEPHTGVRAGFPPMVTTRGYGRDAIESLPYQKFPGMEFRLGRLIKWARRAGSAVPRDFACPRYCRFNRLRRTLSRSLDRFLYRVVHLRRQFREFLGKRHAFVGQRVRRLGFGHVQRLGGRR